MSQPRFYVDEHVPAALVQVLRTAGVDVQTAADAGLLGKDDRRDHLPHILSQGRVLITADHRFRNLLERLAVRGQSHPGIVFLKRPDRVSLLRRWRDDILLIAQCLSAREMRNQVLFVPL